MRLSGQYLVCLFFFTKRFKCKKTQIKQKPTNNTKTSKQKTINATLFCAVKPLREVKWFILRFGDFFKIKIFSEKK